MTGTLEFDPVFVEAGTVHRNISVRCATMPKPLKVLAEVSHANNGYPYLINNPAAKWLNG